MVPRAQQYATVDRYVMWAVLALFVVGVVVSIGGIVGGRILSMHASKAGVVGLFVVFIAAVLYGGAADGRLDHRGGVL